MKDFIKKLEERLIEANAIRSSEDFILHLFGETAEAGEEEKARFIRDTNAKYFNEDSGRLLGNFIEVKVQPESSFIRFNVNEMYDLYREKGMKPVLDKVLSDYNYSFKLKDKAMGILDNMFDYEAIKDKLIFRPLNYTNHREELRDYVMNKNIDPSGDVAFVLYAVVFDDREGEALNTVKIPEMVLEKWLENDKYLTRTDIYKAAMKNTEKFAPARLYTNLMEIPAVDSEYDSPFNPNFKKLDANAVPLLTSERRTNGAIAIMYPMVAERVAELFGDSFYIAFTSIHECMLHKFGTIDANSIRRHVRATNNAFGSEETLSDEVYFYDKERKSFHIV